MYLTVYVYIYPNFLRKYDKACKNYIFFASL